MSSSLNFFNGVPLASVKHARFLTRAGDFYSVAKLIFNRKTYNFSDAAENGAVCYGSNYANWVFIAPDDRFDWDAMAEMTLGDMMTYVIEIATASPVPAWDEFVAWLNGESETLDKVLNACTRAYLVSVDGSESKSTCLYNGVELPDINAVWTDKETYPYAYLSRMDLDEDNVSVHGYALYLSDTVGYRNSTTHFWMIPTSSKVATYFLEDGTSQYLMATSKDSTEVATMLSYPEEAVTPDYMIYCVWCNADICDDNDTATVYLAASDPVPAGGVYTECNVPKLTGSTDFPGFAACLKDATTPAHEEAAASFRTADKAFSFGIELWGADSETGKEQKAATLLFTVRE